MTSHVEIMNLVKYYHDIVCGQTYDNLPYSSHLEQVYQMAVEGKQAWGSLWFNYRDNVLELCLLHDILEDTPITIGELLEYVNLDTVKRIHLVTNVTCFKDKHMNMKATLLNISGEAITVYVKLCDRLVNVENSLRNDNKRLLKKYVDQHEMFMSIMRHGLLFDEMFNRLDHLINQAKQRIK